METSKADVSYAEVQVLFFSLGCKNMRRPSQQLLSTSDGEKGNKHSLLALLVPSSHSQPLKFHLLLIPASNTCLSRGGCGFIQVKCTLKFKNCIQEIPASPSLQCCHHHTTHRESPTETMQQHAKCFVQKRK